MPLALGRAAFMEELERRIETATDRLCEEAAGAAKISSPAGSACTLFRGNFACGPPSPAGTGPGQAARGAPPREVAPRLDFRNVT